MLCAAVSVLLLLLKIVLYTILTFFGLLVTLIIFIKVWFEPVKGVCKCTTKLNGKVALVTGGNSGLGLETARGLARRGARVVIASRNSARSAAAVRDIVTATGNTQVEYRHLDLSKLSSVREFAEEFNKREPRLDILVNNAGAGGIKPRATEDGIEMTTQINYFGAFLLTNLLLDKLEASKPSRIVVVSSLGHRFCSFDPDDLTGVKLRARPGLNTWLLYARSKLLQLFWTRALAKRLPLGVTANALHPGIIKTDIFHRLPSYWQALVGGATGLLFKSPAEGVQTALHLCLAPELEHASGGYYSDCKPAAVRANVWDDALVERIWNDSILITKSV